MEEEFVEVEVIVFEMDVVVEEGRMESDDRGEGENEEYTPEEEEDV